MTFVLLILSF